MSDVVYAGVDVSLETLDLAWVTGTGDPAYLGKFDNTPRGRRKLLNRVRKLGATVHLSLEPTSTYHLDLAKLLHGATGITGSVVNPRAVKDFGKSLMRRGKTDPRDSETLALYCAAAKPRAWAPPSELVMQLRRISRRIEDVTDRRTALQNKLHSAKRGGESPTVIADIKQEMNQIKQRLAKLQAAAKELIREDRQLKRHFRLIKSVAGIADVLGIRILAEMSVLPYDLSKRQWVAMAGLDPVPLESGKMKGARRISRQGNHRVRKALFIAALVGTRWCGPVKAYYEHVQTNSKCSKLQALCAVMRKLLQAIWGVIHTDTPFKAELFYAG